jgi:hypothetical protein
MEHKSTREKMAGMTRREKIDYIWHYYKIHIIGSILLIAFIASFVVDVMRSKEVVLNVTLLGHYVDLNKKEELQNRINDELVNDPNNKQEIRIDFIIKNDEVMDQMAIASMQKLQASIAAADVDIIVVDRKDFELFAEKGMFKSLTDIPEFSSLGLKDEALVKYKIPELDNQEQIYGINADVLDIFRDINYDLNNKILCVVSNTKRQNKAIEFLRWALSQKAV